MTHKIGVVSDTHGLLRPEVLPALAGVEVILHAGDIGEPQVLVGLEAVAPVIAVRGNVDRAAWANHLPETRTIRLGASWIYMLHDLSRLDLDPAAGGFAGGASAVVISGHSHRAGIATKHGVLYLNPGAAGPRRFTLPVTVALLEIEDGRPRAAIVELQV